MYYLNRALIAALGLILGIAPSFAGSLPVTVYTASDGTNYALTHGSTEGSCTPVPAGMHCSSPGGNESSAYDNTGCGVVSGSTFCLVVPDGWEWSGGATPNATSTLECSDKSYVLSTGNDDGTCTENNGSEMTCTDGGGNQAEASCDDGCGTVTGAGSCELK